jgi:hypothetical protein
MARRHSVQRDRGQVGSQDDAVQAPGNDRHGLAGGDHLVLVLKRRDQRAVRGRRAVRRSWRTAGVMISPGVKPMTTRLGWAAAFAAAAAWAAARSSALARGKGNPR